MEKKKITSKKPASKEDKLRRLDRHYTEFTGSEISVKHAFGQFLLSRMEKSSSKPTLDYYNRFYKKLKAYLEDENTPITWLEMDGAQLGFVHSLGDVSQQTVNSYLRAYRAFGNFCEEKGYLDGFKCPIKEVEPPIKDVYTDKELQKLTVKPDIRDFHEFRNYAIIILVLATGARSNTILNLKIKDIDFEDGYVNFNTTKAHKVVRLGLENKARIDLQEFVNFWRIEEGATEDDYVFCNEYKEQLTRSGLCKAIRNYNRSRGVQKTSLHLLRHTFAKNWITSGGDLITLAKVLTHTELDMVKRYSNLYSEDVKDEIAEHSTLSQIRRRSGKTLRSKDK